MAIKNCGKHVYDSDQYSECPYCASGKKVMDFRTVGALTASDINNRRPTAKLTEEQKNQPATQTPDKPQGDAYRTQPADRAESALVQPAVNPVHEPKPVIAQNHVFGASKPVQPSVPAPRPYSGGGINNSDKPGQSVRKASPPVPAPKPAPKPAPRPAPKPDDARKQQPVPYTPHEPVSVNSEEGFLKPDTRVADFEISKSVTVPPSPIDSSPRETKTVGFFHRSISREPVVGWLVCVKGEMKGEDFRILGGMNTIGRSEKMDICLKNDNTVSKEYHARIAYDSRHNNCTIIPGEKSANIYINEDPVYTPVKLSHMDKVEIGESGFVYVSFCDDIFSWKDQ